MKQTICCPGCRSHVRTVRPSLLARGLVPLAWLFCALMVLGGGLLGPFLVVLTPLLVVAGSSVIRVAHEAAFFEPHCPRCGKILVEDGEPPRVEPLVAPGPAGAESSAR